MRAKQDSLAREDRDARPQALVMDVGVGVVVVADELLVDVQVLLLRTNATPDNSSPRRTCG